MISFFIAFLLFDGKWLPDLGSGLGPVIRGFKDYLKEEAKEPRSTGTPDR